MDRLEAEYPAWEVVDEQIRTTLSLENPEGVRVPESPSMSTAKPPGGVGAMNRSRTEANRAAGTAVTARFKSPCRLGWIALGRLPRAGTKLRAALSKDRRPRPVDRSVHWLAALLEQWRGSS